MAIKVKNTLRQPLDIEISGQDKEHPNLHMGPREVSRTLTEDEFKSSQVQANIKAGNIVKYTPPKTTKTKEANK